MLPSVVFINGSFGIGKTTVARALRLSLRGSVIYDPEYVGFVLQRLPRWWRLRGGGTDDFQDFVLWRRSVALGIRIRRFFVRGPVLVPMTFSNVAYLSEVLARVRAFEPNVRVFCLRASRDTIHDRLRTRGSALEGPNDAWVLRRVAECVAAHADSRFGDPVATEQQTVMQVSEQIRAALQRHGQ